IYFPIAGKPPMLVESSEIFGGWFKFFGIQGAKFQYITDNKVDILGGPVAVDSPDLIPAGDLRRLRVQIPAHYESWVGDGSNIHHRGASQGVYGWFGPGAINQKTCLLIPDGAEALSSAYVDSALTQHLLWNPLFKGTPGPADVIVSDGGDPTRTILTPYN